MMLPKPQIVIIDEPTPGIDIGTKEQIYRFIAISRTAAASVIVISSEMQELIGICDRVLVMREGRIVGEVSGGDRMSERRSYFSRPARRGGGRGRPGGGNA